MNVLEELKHLSVTDIKDYCVRNTVDASVGMINIGGDFNLTKERVRQIKEKALRKLRNDSSILYEYM